MMKCDEFLNPISFDSIKKIENYDGVLIPGGHDPNVVTLIDNKILQSKLEAYFGLNCENKPIGAICHGVGLLARSQKFVTFVMFDFDV